MVKVTRAVLRRLSRALRAAPSLEGISAVNVIGIGTDIIECLRIAQMIERHGELFIHRVYTPDEIGYCQSRKQSTQHFAGRWAAKEAVLKALGTGWRRGISWRDVEVRNTPGGRPVVSLRGGAQDVVEELGIREMLVSISHCRSHAMAYALALGGKSSGRSTDE
jgi:holo-[acyl-carrier protein] synthase